MTQSDAPNEEKTPDAYISEDLFTKIARSEVIVLADDVQYVRKDVAVKIMDSYADYRTKELRDQLSKERREKEKLKELHIHQETHLNDQFEKERKMRKELVQCLFEMFNTLNSDDTALIQFLPEGESTYRNTNWIKKAESLIAKASELDKNQ